MFVPPTPETYCYHNVPWVSMSLWMSLCVPNTISNIIPMKGILLNFGHRGILVLWCAD